MLNLSSQAGIPPKNGILCLLNLAKEKYNYRESARHDHGQYCFSCMCGKDCRCKGCFSLHMQVLEREVEISRLETELEYAKLNRSTGEISNLRTTRIFNTSKFLDNDSRR